MSTRDLITQAARDLRAIGARSEAAEVDSLAARLRLAERQLGALREHMTAVAALSARLMDDSTGDTRAVAHAVWRLAALPTVDVLVIARDVPTAYTVALAQAMGAEVES